MQESQPNNIRKVALTSLAGTSIEWYDFFLYGASAALIFPTIFFGQDVSIEHFFLPMQRRQAFSFPEGNWLQANSLFLL